MRHLQIKGDLKFGQYKSITCNVQLQVDIHQDDEWAEPDPNYNPADYIDGVKVYGELSFDISPIEWQDKHPVKPNAIGELTLRDGEDSTKISVLMVEKTATVDILPKKIKRYFWLFFAVGKPLWDKLGIFPDDYRGVTMNRVYSCTNFRGYWPVGVASIIVASDKTEAKNLLHEKLREAGIHIEDCDLELNEISIQQKGAVILNDGVWQ